MGGTFDPIHMGHLILGEQSYEQLHLDKVLFMPSGNPPHKRNRAGRASDGQRVDMVRLAIEDNPHFELSLAEMHETGYTYTYRTLEELKEQNPDTDYYFIIGADSLFTLDEWREPGIISRECILLAATRDHCRRAEIEQKITELKDMFGADIRILNTPDMEIASADIRGRIAEGGDISQMLPAEVEAYIRSYHLYEKG